METAPLFNDIAEGPDNGRAFWSHCDDGVRIRLGHWRAPENTRGTVLLFPGRTEYIEKYGRTAADLALRGYDTFCVDWRCQGLADRLSSDPLLGHVGKFSDYQRDVQAMLNAAQSLDLPQPFFLLAHSMGGCIGLRALHLNLPVSAAAFSGPMWGIAMSATSRLFASISARLAVFTGRGARFAPTTGPQTYVLAAPFEDNQLTTDRGMWDYMVHQAKTHPELTLGGPSITWFHEAVNECAALTRAAPPDYPVLCMLGAQERIVDPRPVHDIMGRWKNPRFEVVPGAEHEILMERPDIRAGFLAAADTLFTQTAP